MKHPDPAKLRYWAYLLVVVVLILTAFNTVITLMIHKKIEKIVTNPGRWPGGAYEYDRTIGFDFAPSVSGKIQDGSFYVKSHTLGYRIGEYEDETAYRPGGILSLGCSFTYGDEVNSEQTFTQIAADGMLLPAYNYGICSFSYIHALLKARKLGETGILDKLKPRFVILGCWSGLPDRSRTPFPPTASDNLPMPSAFLEKKGEELRIQEPMKLQHVFGMVDQYRKEGPGLSASKFFRLFFAAPKYLYLYMKNNRMSQAMKIKSFKNDVTNFDVYDYYFTGIEEVFSPYGSSIIVLFMPNRSDERPDRALSDALARHPGLLLVDGMEAINRYGVSGRDYLLRHPQPPAHKAYGQEIANRLKNGGR